MTPDEMVLSLQILMVTNTLTALMVTFLARKGVRVLSHLEWVTGSVGGEETSVASPSAISLPRKQEPVPETKLSDDYICLYEAVKASRSLDVIRALSWTVKSVPRAAFQSVLENLPPNLHRFAWDHYADRARSEGSSVGSKVNRYSAL